VDGSGRQQAEAGRQQADAASRPRRRQPTADTASRSLPADRRHRQPIAAADRRRRQPTADHRRRQPTPPADRAVMREAPARSQQIRPTEPTGNYFQNGNSWFHEDQ
jgi:hypothetical protein